MAYRAKGLPEAIELANDNPYGLASAVWTREPSEARIAISERRAGATFVNSLVRSDPRWPFGGIRQSGYGRELSREGILEFVNRKTVVIEDLGEVTHE
jgi:succinate-semialdehyde dehydrogenase/glutarate-semialdehyde dehydrogenase